ncbi:MAG TPA: MarR family transcriptional regulator, partial [Bradyrhizobium sp.]|nr:MarR family transcriptional regulator [Bradyrhizobium sp.]
MRKIASSAKSRAAKKAPERRKSARAKNASRRRQKSADDPGLAGVRPPPPGRGKRGEKGYLAYLLRQAQAATRLTLERALADIGVTSPQFAV